MWSKKGKVKSSEVKSFAKKVGADIVGVAPISRFEGAPMEMHPSSIFPEAKSVIVLGFRILRGCLRGIEEGTYFVGYPMWGKYHIQFVLAPTVLRKVSLFLEDFGYEAVPLTNRSLSNSMHVNPLEGEKEGSNESKSSTGTGFATLDFWRMGGSSGRRVAPDRPDPDVTISCRFAAVAAGLGEIGYSKMFLSPEFGPRQRLAVIITDAPLEPDSLFDGKICDRCMLCVKDCSGEAISRNQTEKCTVAGKELEWGKLSVRRCQLACTGGVPETSPFTPPDYDFEAAVKDPSKGMLDILYNKLSFESFHEPGHIEGARGCIRACMIHLEETERIKNTFRNPFRKRKMWRLK